MTISQIKNKLKVDPKVLLVYIVLYFSWGMLMDWFGSTVKIAEFTYWWQVITCYIFYMVPISLFLREYKWYDQYAYGLVSMGLLEFGGYALGTSIHHPNNLMDQYFSEQNFALGMALFFALYYPIGNWAVAKISKVLFGEKINNL